MDAVLLRWSAIATTLLLSSGLVNLTAASASQAAPMSASAITWSSCYPALASLGLQIGSLLVPLDHAKPAGRVIRLALTRKVHTNTAYRGVMPVNPGGPGVRGSRWRFTVPTCPATGGSPRTGAASTRVVSARAAPPCTA